MKTNHSLPKWLALLAFLILSASGPTASAVTFTVTPSAVSNTYSGTITLQIGGLTNTETVVVQKFLDLNTNGVINGSDWLVQQFTLQDGTNFAIGGVTNFNVPGDLNATTGAITATLNFQNGDFVQNIVGKYLFKLSSPVGHFTPITNNFSVTNFPWPQKFTGNVVSNSTSTTVSNAVVLLFAGEAGSSPQAGVVANNAGSYTVQAPPGTYSLIAIKSNYVANANTAPMLTLAASQTITTNLTMTNATASISGTNVDASSSSIRLPGVMVVAQSTNGQMAVTFTDTNGLFNARVTAGKWKLKADNTTLIVHGYLGLQNKTNVTAGTTGVSLPVPKATALIYGNVKDNSGNPLPALDVYANDNTINLYETDGYTDTNGNYVVGVLGGLGTNDLWGVQVICENIATNYVFSQPDFGSTSTNGGVGGTNISANSASLINFTAIPATNHITGNVKDSNGSNIEGVEVDAWATINGVNYNANNGVDTDANGNYALTVCSGSWNVHVNSDYVNGRSLDDILGSGTYQAPSGQTAAINNNNATNNFTIQLCGGISILTASPMPVGEVNVYFDQFLQASSCNDNFSWAILSGTPVPGFNANFSTGEIYGTPTSAGTYTLNFQVTDGDNLTTNKQLAISISNALQMATTTLPNGTNGSTYSQALQATAGVPFGGASPYSWSVAAGSLPASLTLATNGLLSGTLAASGTFNFTAQVTDALGGSFDQSLALTIVSTGVYPPLTVGTGGGQVLIYWPMSAGTNYTVQMTTNLATGPWVTATNGVPVAAFTFTNQGPAAFFRLH
jgi:hypothetical protein